MKLVDWDKVKISYDKQVSGTIIEPIYNIKVEAPIVKAIPLDWIEKWAEKWYKSEYTTMEYSRSTTNIGQMIDDWEKENE